MFGNSYHKIHKILFVSKTGLKVFLKCSSQGHKQNILDAISPNLTVREFLGFKRKEIMNGVVKVQITQNQQTQFTSIFIDHVTNLLCFGEAEFSHYSKLKK